MNLVHMPAIYFKFDDLESACIYLSTIATDSWMFDQGCTWSNTRAWIWHHWCSTRPVWCRWLSLPSGPTWVDTTAVAVRAVGLVHPELRGSSSTFRVVSCSSLSNWGLPIPTTTTTLAGYGLVIKIEDSLVNHMSPFSWIIHYEQGCNMGLKDIDVTDHIIIHIERSASPQVMTR